MEDFESIPIRYRDRLKLKMIDRYPHRYQRVLVKCVAALVVAATVGAATYDVVHEPSYEERLSEERTDFVSCLDDHLTPSQYLELTRQQDLQFAFPEYQLDPVLQEALTLCREEHPMPQE